jgi:hypothetical protein
LRCTNYPQDAAMMGMAALICDSLTFADFAVSLCRISIKPSIGDLARSLN